MAILISKTELIPGNQLTAQTVNDISETAVESYKLAQEAYKQAQEAKGYAKTLIDEAIGQALNSEV